ncbi:Cytochrome bd-I ubiquinol oxidase subunit 2 [Paraburkholderia ultramafica]|uniref:Cytochrome bd-I ubiquinol oxidase subunit 2 n=1 Tax=Paraburkholderia ultramafica TaxID=1544867 RepID=A0A6S7B3D6_9BURK|nr:cytochrome d ubiquinol oxidase subunit II [Paraburkholderia ultramafica]CAB3779554.1 Cytochrome bd-I ubiquinol oxidase subunit 2 [Paraburkholderia ultramafica]
MDLTLIWAAIIALGILLYVVLDGFDLGTGIIYPFFPDAHERDLIMGTLAPIWDGNETWLVLGGAALFGVFPVVYSAVLSALYLPLVFMLACLILRGVSLELRSKSRRTKNLWDLAFIGGSAGATFFQGISLGAYLQGIPAQNGVFVGDAFGWLTPFSMLTGLGLVATYALLGCCWLIAKTEGDLQRRLHRMVWPLTLVLLAFIALVSIWTPLQQHNVAARWFESDWFDRMLPAPFLVVICAVLMRRAARVRRDTQPFVLALALVVLGYAGLLATIWPYAIPSSVTLWQAAAPHSTQVFTLVGAVVILPIIFAYSAFGYWVFRGKVRHDELHYH